jgi:hypothetical protein
MLCRRAAVAAILCLVFAACGADADPPATLRASQDATSLIGVTPSPLTAVASPSPVATPGPTQKPTPKATLIPVPPKPTGVRFRQDAGCLDAGCGRAQRVTQTVRWRAPRTKGVEIRVYGVTECLAMPAHPEPDSGGPCLVEHTALPASVRTLLATAPATAGRVSWSWKQDTGCENWGMYSPPDRPVYAAVVIAAYNASGHSIFAIATQGDWYQPPPGDTLC